MKFNCPFCGVELDADANPGDLGDCPICGHEFRVPDVPSTEEEPAPEPKRKSIRVPGKSKPSLHNAIASHKARAQAEHQTLTGSTPYVSSGFGASLFVMILNLPLGIVAVVLSALAEGAKDTGNQEESKKFATASGYVRIAGWTAFGLTIALFVVLALCGAFGGGRGSSYF